MQRSLSFIQFVQLGFILFLGWMTIEIMQGEYPTLLHNVNLVFHEAGHVLFIVFGHFLYVLGGSITQIIIPVILIGYFLLRYNFYAASVMFWWMGTNFIDVAIYVGDSRARVLPILGGDNAHDWVYLLNRTGLLEYDLIIADFFWYPGALVMIGAIVFGIIALLRTKTSDRSKVII